jgi:hypothetical protein
LLSLVAARWVVAEHSDGWTGAVPPVELVGGARSARVTCRVATAWVRRVKSIEIRGGVAAGDSVHDLVPADPVHARLAIGDTAKQDAS